MSKPIISADSHITEPPDCYTAHIGPRYRDKAPHITQMQGLGDVFVIDGMPSPIPLGLVAAAGLDPKDIKADGVAFKDLHRSGWDPNARQADQERDGVAAEILYPTVGMVICNHPDVDYKKACYGRLQPLDRRVLRRRPGTALRPRADGRDQRRSRRA